MFKGIRPTIVAFVLVVGLIAFFGGQLVIKHFYLEKPFKEEVLSIEGVSNVRIENVGDMQKVYLTVDSAVELKEAYIKVNEFAQEMLQGQFVVEIENSASSEKMKKLYDEMHFAIYEGIARGQFTQMAAQVKEIAAEDQVENLDIKVDNSNVYLTMVKDGEIYSKVIARKTEQLAYLTGERDNRGGESQW